MIGCAGSDEKVLWLQKLGFDQVFNYKSCDLDEALKKHAPNGIDVYLETVSFCLMIKRRERIQRSVFDILF